MRKISLFFVIVVLASCLSACVKDEFVENKPPVVHAGNDTSFQLSGSLLDTITLSGSATDADGQVLAYHWSQVAGPNTALIHNPGSATTKVSGMVPGIYLFQLMATDDKGATGVKKVQVNTTSAPILNVTVQPANNTSEVFAYSYDPTTPQVGDTQIPIGSWTVGGSPVHYRAFLKLNFNIPANATIISAKLSLYSMPSPHGGNMVDAQYGNDNAFTIRRITAPYTATATTWNNQPTTTQTNQVTLVNSTSSTQDALNIDVTQLVKDMQLNGNHGFAMKLVTENPYNIRQYASSLHVNASKRPKLEILYTN